MIYYPLKQKKQQQGMVTLVISTLLLFAASLISLFSSKAIILEQKISTNNYHAIQTFYTANATLNKLSARVKKPKEINIKTANQTHSAEHITSHQLAAVPIAGNGLGKIITFPLITRLGIKLTENLAIVNLYSHNKIWSGDKILLKQQLMKQLSASILDKDFNLKNLSNIQFFENFLNESAAFIKQLATDNQSYYSAIQIQEVDQQSGLIWLGDGGQSLLLDNAVIGSKEQPAIIIADATNSTFTTRGTISIYGLLYIKGNWHPTGSINIYGGVIVEDKILATENPELVSTHIYYQPDMLKPKIPLANTIASVAGSWRYF